MTRTPHTSVLLHEVLEVLQPKDGGIYVDGTFGWGGYARAILESADCTVWGIDRDPSVVARAHDMETEFKGRLSVIEGRFGDMAELLSARGISGVDGVALDLGVSSMQLDQAERGFSFQSDGPLDMRMESKGLSAADVVNEMDEAELADVIYELGEERRSRQVAHAIALARAEQPFTRTLQLARVIRSVVRKSKDGIDPATRTFQALRIHVNDELGQIDQGLEQAEMVLKPGGRLAVVSFHSLEDKRVKAFLNQHGGNVPNPSRHMPDSGKAPVAAPFKLLKKGAIKPGREEEKANPRSRSARLRGAMRTEAPAWAEGRAA